MSIRSIPFAPGEYYHVFNRGNGKGTIFREPADYERFLKLLYVSNSDKSFVFRDIKDPFALDRGKTLASIGAYALMPNHFHLLMKEESGNGITGFLHKLCTSYSRYFNLKYGRSGKLFEDKFKSQYASSDQQLKYLFSYIHLNPLKLHDPKWRQTRSQDININLLFLRNYDYSSYKDFLGEDRKENVIVTRENFPEYFPSKKHFEKEILDWIKYEDPI